MSESETESRESAQQHEEEREKAKEEMRELEEADEVPKKLEDWPGGKAKYETFGGPEGDAGYEDGATAKLGPSSLRHHEDGGVSIEGEQVDDPEEYKGDPIPGGPTDPNANPDPGATSRGEAEGDGEQESEED
jgi:hypothetical protein